MKPEQSNTSIATVKMIELTVESLVDNLSITKEQACFVALGAFSVNEEVDSEPMQTAIDILKCIGEKEFTFKELITRLENKQKK
jgi:hypothetical protein